MNNNLRFAFGFVGTMIFVIIGFGYVILHTSDIKEAAALAAEKQLEAPYECYALINQIKPSPVKDVYFKAPELVRLDMLDNKMTVAECDELTNVYNADKIVEAKAVYKIMREVR